MTIQEAIKSGKPFRRPNSWDGWLDISRNFSNQGWFYSAESLSGHAEKWKKFDLTANDITADDWEIKREPREVWRCGVCHYQSVSKEVLCLRHDDWSLYREVIE